MSFKIEHIFEGIQGKNETIIIPNLLQGFASKSSYWEPVSIHIGEDIDIDMANSVADKLKQAENNDQPFIPVFIHSNGGDVYSCLNIVESIKRCKIPIYTFVNSCAFSCGAVIFSCGKQRFMGKYARLLLHDVSIDIGQDTSISSSNLNVESKEMRKLNRQMFEIMAENTGHPKNYYLDLLKTQRNNDVYLDGKKALELNLATCMGIPIVKVTHTTTMTLDIIEEKQHKKSIIPAKPLVKMPIKTKKYITKKKKINGKNEKFIQSLIQGKLIRIRSPTLVKKSKDDDDDDDDDDDVNSDDDDVNSDDDDDDDDSSDNDSDNDSNSGGGGGGGGDGGDDGGGGGVGGDGGDGGGGDNIDD
jgi:ATP-dependent protease ClpP protease subunit